MQDLTAANFSATELKAMGYSAQELKAVNFTVTDLVAARYSLESLKAAGSPPIFFPRHCRRQIAVLETSYKHIFRDSPD